MISTATTDISEEKKRREKEIAGRGVPDTPFSFVVATLQQATMMLKKSEA